MSLVEFDFQSRCGFALHALRRGIAKQLLFFLPEISALSSCLKSRQIYGMPFEVVLPNSQLFSSEDLIEWCGSAPTHFGYAPLRKSLFVDDLPLGYSPQVEENGDL